MAATLTVSSSSTTLLTFPGNRKTVNTRRNKTIVRVPEPSNSKPTSIKSKIGSWRVLGLGINEVNSATDMGQVEVTWQTIVGAIAGVTPFVVAGIEFAKRINAQRRCEVCGGSGLVYEDKDFFRCPGCGGFLPWQSWKRFFTS